MSIATAVGSTRTQPEPWLRSRNWDRIFILGGALLVPIPIAVYYLCRGLGASLGASEDIVTLVVMVLVGGPHAFATYTRTLLEPQFRRREIGWTIAAFVVIGIVIAATVTSAFFDWTILGFPPIQFVLTFFFFWAGLHIVQQSSYCAACYEKKRAGLGGWWRLVPYAVMLLCLYPMSFFRMSMIHPTDPGLQSANPDALATQLVAGLTSPEFADSYVFRIGRVAPILPDMIRAEFFWMAITAAFVVALVLFVIKTRREIRTGTLNRPQFYLVTATAVVGVTVSLMPNLDSAFQGFNAWHSFQYLGLLWLMNRRSFDRGEITSPFVQKLSKPGGHRKFYMTALGITIGMVACFFALGMVMQWVTDGKFLLFGREASAIPTNPDTGRPFYRPGSLLLAYYMIGFGFLLVHYLHDGYLLLRTKLLVDPESESAAT